MTTSDLRWRSAAWLLASAIATTAAGSGHAGEPDPPGGDSEPVATPDAEPPADDEATRSEPDADSPASEGEPAKAAPEGSGPEAPAAVPPAAPPAAPPPAAPAPPVANARPAPEPMSADARAGEPSTTDWSFVGGIITVSAGAVFLFVGNYALFRLNDAVREDDMRGYRATVPEGESSCDYARSGFASGAEGVASPGEVADRCDELEALEVVRNVFLPVGVVATAVGILLIGTSDTVNHVGGEADEARRWRWNVGVGATGGGASVTLAW